METKEPHYFKFVSALIDRGVWARMSAAARALYPVLLRFSDRHFREVWPGTQKLLELTGFKQKASLRKAREELVRLGLISVARGSGRQNSVYSFRFDWITRTSPTGSPQSPPADYSATPLGDSGEQGEGVPGTPQYNQIHISINNTQKPDAGAQTGATATQGLEVLEQLHGREAVRLAISECELAGVEPTPESVRKILYHGKSQPGQSWADVERFLESRISPGSLQMIRDALLEEEGEVLVFRDILPEYLKRLLKRFDQRLYFEPQSTDRREFWRRAGNTV